MLGRTLIQTRVHWLILKFLKSSCGPKVRSGSEVVAGQAVASSLMEITMGASHTSLAGHGIGVRNSVARWCGMGCQRQIGRATSHSTLPDVAWSCTKCTRGGAVDLTEVVAAYGITA